MENAGPGSRGTGSQGVENMGSVGKHGVWKTRGLVENTGSKCKTRGNHYTIQNSKNLTYKCEALNKTCASTTLKGIPLK